MAEEFRHHFPELQIVTFEAFNAAQAALKERRLVPPKSQGSPYVLSGLLRCPECGGKTVGTRRWRNGKESKRYSCGPYHFQGKTACKGWVVFEQTTMKAVIPFLADLLDNKLRVRAHLNEAAIQMQREQSGEMAQTFQADIANAKHELGRIQEGYLAKVFNAEEAGTKSLEARERIERAESKLKELSSSKDMKRELAEALSLLNAPIEQILAEMDRPHLARLCRQVFQHLTIRGTGGGRARDAEIVSYELTAAIKQALATSLHIDSDVTAIVPGPLTTDQSVVIDY